MNEESARELVSNLNREFRGWGYFYEVEAEPMCAGGWKVTIT